MSDINKLSESVLAAVLVYELSGVILDWKEEEEEEMDGNLAKFLPSLSGWLC